MYLMPHNQTKAQSRIKSFDFVSCGILSWLHTEQQWNHRSSSCLLPTPFSLLPLWRHKSLELVKVALPKDKHRLWRLLWRCLLHEGEGGETKERFWTGYFSWEINSLIGVFLYQLLNCYPLLLLIFLSFACGCHNVWNVFKIRFLSKKKRNMALKRSLWQKKRK